MDSSSCGLDFGMSNSTLGLVDETGAPFLVPLEGEAQLSSVLFFSFEDDQIYVGQSALDEYVAVLRGGLCELV